MDRSLDETIAERQVREPLRAAKASRSDHE